MKATGKKAALEAFRRLPEFELPLEFYGERIIQKMSPRLVHSIIRTNFMSEMYTYCRPKKLGRVYLELRSTFGGISIVPDISHFSEDRKPDPTNPVDREDVLFAPDLIVEILSPGQTVSELTRKIRFAIRVGVRFGWLINEAERKVLIFQQGSTTRVIGTGDSLTGEDKVPGYTLAIDELFGWVDHL